MTPSSAALRVQSGFCSEAGRRPGNEDFCAVVAADPGRMAGVVAAIADGVGGAKAGRTAAELAVRGFIDGCLGQSETLEVRRTAGRAIESLNRWIHGEGRRNAERAGMACTLTGLVLRGRRLHVLHVGDTRLYRLRDGALARLTADHRPESAAIGNVLTRAIGAEETVRIDHASEDLQAHDRLLLTCDGVHDVLSDRAIEAELARRAGPEETARALVRAAIDAGGEDNATALVLDVLELPAADLAGLGAALAALPVRPPPSAGVVVDDFELAELLADGRYSRVFRARDRLTGAAALLKFPKPQALGAEAAARGAFLREAWVASRVQSPWVGAVADLPPGRRTSLYLAQPFYEGETLERRLARRPKLPLDQGLDIAVKLAKAVAALHRAGVIHRDIKPENVILQADGGLKLVDLGVARLPHLEAFPAPDIPGTPSYMAPELFAGAPGDERTDVFALGATLYRALTGGAYPYGEIEPFTTPRHRAPTPLAAHRPDLPAWLETALARALAADPEARMQDAFELIFALEHGAARAAPARPGRLPLFARDPVRTWQVIALVLFVLLMASLAGR